jgi:DNA-binding CsgD family transcriptional regulator
MPRTDAKPGTPLTARQESVMRLLAKGRTPRYIAYMEGIAYKSVLNQIRQSRIKMGVETTEEAIAICRVWWPSW